jgi:hypothetical protein
MSVIATYARVNEGDIDQICNNAEWMDVLYDGRIANAKVMDVDKACDGIVWLLSRVPVSPAASTPGEGFTLRRSLAPLLSGVGGHREPRLEAPYGPASVLNQHQVKELSDWLRTINTEQLRMRYHPRSMADAGIYPQIWIEEGPAAFEEYLLPHFEHLRTFLSEAMTANQHVIVFFT